VPSHEAGATICAEQKRRIAGASVHDIKLGLSNAKRVWLGGTANSAGNRAPASRRRLFWRSFIIAVLLAPLRWLQVTRTYVNGRRNESFIRFAASRGLILAE